MRAKKWLQEGRFHLCRKKSFCQRGYSPMRWFAKGHGGVLRTRQLRVTCQGYRRWVFQMTKTGARWLLRSILIQWFSKNTFPQGSDIEKGFGFVCFVSNLGQLTVGYYSVFSFTSIQANSFKMEASPGHCPNSKLNGTGGSHMLSIVRSVCHFNWSVITNQAHGIDFNWIFIVQL